MAKVFQNSGRVEYRALADEVRHPVPGGATNITEFDEASNPQLLADLKASTDPFSFVAGALRKSGVAVTINADSAETLEKKDFDTIVAGYIADLQAYLLIADGATNAQVRTQTKLLTQGMIRVARLIKQLRKLQG